MRLSSILGYWKAIVFLTTFFLLGCKVDPPKTVPVIKTVSVEAHYQKFQVIGKIVFDGGEEIKEKGFFISTHSNPTAEDRVISGYQHSYNDPDLFSALFDGLDPNKNYYIRAYAVNSLGIAYGETLSFQEASKSLVTTKPASDVTKTEAVLHGLVNPINSEAENWFEYWSDGESVKKAQLPKLNGDKELEVNIKLEGLTLGTVYFYTLKSNNSSGESVGDTLQFETYAVNDIDGNLYHVVTIGQQVWLKENFRGTHYSNGDPILHSKDLNEWKNTSVGMYCWYNHDPEIGKEYGGLYNWYVATDPRGLIEGWHTPTNEEFREFVQFIDNGSINSTGRKIMEVGAGHWVNSCPIIASSNETGFTALPNGYFNPYSTDKSFVYLGSAATFWGSSTLFEAANLGNIFDCLFACHGFSDKHIGCGIRLIKD